MSLSSAINTAQTIFNNTAAQTALVSKNIQNVSNADYSRRMAMLGTSGNGAQIVSIQRAQNDALMKQHSLSISQASAQDALLTGLEAVKSALGGNGYETSPSNYLKSFRDSLQTYAATPGNTSIAATTVSSAADLAKSLNKTSAAVQEVRYDADKEIDASVKKLNGLLAEFEKANGAVQGATASGADASDALDQRDKLLRQISEVVGISTVTRANNDTVIYTSDGTVLFENTARSVTFQATPGFGATTAGNAIYVDGVALKAGKGADTSGEGKLASLLQLRDETAPKFQSQLDEIARGLVTLFQEKHHPGHNGKTGSLYLGRQHGSGGWNHSPRHGSIADDQSAGRNRSDADPRRWVQWPGLQVEYHRQFRLYGSDRWFRHLARHKHVVRPVHRTRWLQQHPRFFGLLDRLAGRTQKRRIDRQ